MSVVVRLECGGCDAVSDEFAIRRRYDPIVPGAIGGWCRIVTDDVNDKAPAGWVAFDPYTHATYCPECWAAIENGDAA